MENNRKEKAYRKGKAGVAYAILAVVLIAAAILGACVVFFRVEYVKIEGNSRYSEEQVRTVADVTLGSNLILAPNDQIAQRIYHSLPYVDTVKIQKRFPTTLKIVITECQPIAAISGNGQQWIIDAKGKVLERADETLALQYLAVSGFELTDPKPGEPAAVADENKGQLTGLEGLLTVLQNEGIAGQITAIDASSKTEIAVTYQNRLKVKFLINADFDRKIRIFQEIAAVVGDNAQGTVDLKTERGYFTPG